MDEADGGALGPTALASCTPPIAPNFIEVGPSRPHCFKVADR